MSPAKFTLPLNQLKAFRRRWNVDGLWLLGSVLRDDFRADSDINVMVQFREGLQLDVKTYLAMREELEQYFGRAVDLVERREIERSPNFVRRRHILESAKRIDVA